jgi:protocatechuate 3,4-dioxygenase beta subunit
MRNLSYVQFWVVVFLLETLCVSCGQSPSTPTVDPGRIVTNLTPSNTTLEPPPISGYITDDNGNPIARARVIPEVLTPGVPLPLIAITSDANGYYAINTLHPAEYRITINADRYISETKQVTFDGRPISLNFTLRSNK